VLIGFTACDNAGELHRKNCISEGKKEGKPGRSPSAHAAHAAFDPLGAESDSYIFRGAHLGGDDVLEAWSTGELAELLECALAAGDAIVWIRGEGGRPVSATEFG
jgi:hypothetical protein